MITALRRIQTLSYTPRLRCKAKLTQHFSNQQRRSKNNLSIRPIFASDSSKQYKPNQPISAKMTSFFGGFTSHQKPTRQSHSPRIPPLLSANLPEPTEVSPLSQLLQRLGEIQGIAGRSKNAYGLLGQF